MSRRAPSALLLAVLVFFPIAAGAQAPAAKPAAPRAAYEVRQGDTLYGIARRLRPADLTLAQMVLALFRANPEAFVGGNINQLRMGARLTVPPSAQVAAVAPAEAAREVSALVSQPATPVPAPPPAPAAKPRVAAIPPTLPARPLGREEAERRYLDGLAMERRGDDRGALQAFLEAGEAGHGLAQRHLGEIYGKGNRAAERDYEVSIRWYQKAREQGVEIPKPLPRAPAMR